MALLHQRDDRVVPAGLQDGYRQFRSGCRLVAMPKTIYNSNENSL